MPSSDAVFSTGDSDFMKAVTEEIPGLYRYALTLVGDPESAEWLVSDTLSKAWEKSSTFRSESGLSTWLHRILHNLAVDNARKRAREVSVEEVEDKWRDGAFSVDPEQVVEMADDLEELRDSLLRLPFAYRSVLLLHDVEEWKLPEIAVSLEISLSAAKQRLRRGRMMLVSALSEGAARKAAGSGMSLSCWQARSMVSDYLDGELSGTTREAQLVDHLSNCVTCPPLYTALVGVKASLTGMRDPDAVISPDVIKRIRRATNDRP